MCTYPDITTTPPAHIRNISQTEDSTRGFGWIRQNKGSSKKYIDASINNSKCSDREWTGIFSILQNLLPLPKQTCIAELIPWSTANSAPMPIFEAANAVVNDKFYVFGGFNSKFQGQRRADVYDPSTNLWEQLPDLPAPITHAGVAVDGNTIYLAGGYIGDEPNMKVTDQVWKYDVVSKTWSQAPSLPLPRGAGGLVLLDRELHFFGGINYNKTIDRGNHWVLNIDSGTSWVSKAPLPNPRNHFGYTVNNGKIYTIGGQKLLKPRTGNQSDVHAYDPTTDTWTQVASLNMKRSHTHTSTFNRNGKIVIVGGLTNGTTHAIALDQVSQYDPNSNTWVELSPLLEPRQAAAAKLINNQFVVTTGAVSRNIPQTTTWLGAGEVPPVISAKLPPLTTKIE